MICQQVTLSGDAEWPKVADAVIEAVKAVLKTLGIVRRSLSITSSIPIIDRAAYPKRGLDCRRLC